MPGYDARVLDHYTRDMKTQFILKSRLNAKHFFFTQSAVGRRAGRPWGLVEGEVHVIEHRGNSTDSLFDVINLVLSFWPSLKLAQDS